MKANPNTCTTIRLRLTAEQAARLSQVQRFLGLPSLSQAAARLTLWNADALAAALGDEDASRSAGEQFRAIARQAAAAALKS